MASGAHPDDIELGVGGTLAVLAAQGYRVAMVDLTRGELATRGNVDTRAAEAQEAARVLGVAHRENAGLPDGGLRNDDSQRQVVAGILRRLRPRLLLAQGTPDRHPDHLAAHELTRDAHFYAGVARYPAEGARHRADDVWWYHPYALPDAPPAWVSDIGAQWETKLAALRAHRSQFHDPGRDAPETMVSSPAFWEGIEIRARFWGAAIGAVHGEPLWRSGPARVNWTTWLGQPHTQG